MEVRERVEVARPGDVLRDSAEVREHLVGEDDRDRDRDQRLAQVLALRPAEEELLHHEARGCDDCDPDERRQDPVREVDLRALQAEGASLADHAPLDRERDVAAEQEERAVRHVDDAHQPEDEREAARDDEVEAGGGDAVQHGDQEVLRVVHGRAEASSRTCRSSARRSSTQRTGSTASTASVTQPAIRSARTCAVVSLRRRRTVSRRRRVASVIRLRAGRGRLPPGAGSAAGSAQRSCAAPDSASGRAVSASGQFSSIRFSAGSRK